MMNELSENMPVVRRNEKFVEDCSLAVLLQPFEMNPKQLQLLEAARKNDVAELEKLLAKRVNVNASNNLERTALHWAAANGNGEAIEVLFRAAANVNATDKYGMTPLLLASWFGHVTALEKLAKNKRIIINCANKQEMNAIHCAAANDHINVMQFFHANQLIAKMDINKQELRGKTSLHLAAEKGFEEMVDYLLTIGSDPLPTDLTGRTALHLASAGGHSDVTSSLLQIPGLSINQADNEGLTALHLASAAGHGSVVQLLILANADINAQTQKGMSALTLASAGGHIVTASQLVMNSFCDRNHQNEDGNTALHLASSNDKVNIARLLIANGCDVNLVNKLGQTALHMAAEKGYSPIVQLLLLSRADPTRRDGSGKTALALASRANHVSVADMIIKKERLEELINYTTMSSDCDPGGVSGFRDTNPAAVHPPIAEDDDVRFQVMTLGATRCQEGATLKERNADQEEDRSEDKNKENSANDIDTIDAVSRHPIGYHDNHSDSESVREDRINENSENPNSIGATEVNPRSAGVVDIPGSSRSSSTLGLTPNPYSERRNSEGPGGCYLNTGFSLDESVDLRAGPRDSGPDGKFRRVQPKAREDETSSLESDSFRATTPTAGDAEPNVNSTADDADSGRMSSAVDRTNLTIGADLFACDSRVAATDLASLVHRQEEPNSRNLSRSISERSHASGISFQVPESESSVFQGAAEGDTVSPARRRSSVDRMLAMKEVLWKLAMNQLNQGEWKRIAKHWKFTEEQIRAIEHQHTGSKSYRDHGYRMLVIWLECYLEVNPPPNGNPLRGLFDALVAINRRKLAEQIRSKCNRPSDTRKSCTIS